MFTIFLFLVALVSGLPQIAIYFNLSLVFFLLGLILPFFSLTLNFFVSMDLIHSPTQRGLPLSILGGLFSLAWLIIGVMCFSQMWPTD